MQRYTRYNLICHWKWRSSRLSRLHTIADYMKCIGPRGQCQDQVRYLICDFEYTRTMSCYQLSLMPGKTMLIDVAQYQCLSRG